ncbi:hypothetical protein ACFQY9_12170 [Microvirga aerilata]
MSDADKGRLGWRGLYAFSSLTLQLIRICASSPITATLVGL